MTYALRQAPDTDQPVHTAPQAPLLPHWFDYDLAFSRNIGWTTEWEQQRLRASKIAIAGMGGVGGVHMLTLARLGIGRFSVADFDRFEVANFNRQMGASARTLGQPKAESVVMLAREINPEIEVDAFDQGVNEDNIEAFLDGVSVYVDGLDFFVLDIRRKLFALARAKGIPAVTAAPIGMGTGYLIFTPDGMSFDDYFGFVDGDTQGNYVRFLLGLTPAMLHRSYLQDPSRVDMMDKRGPSTAIACQLCAGVAAAEVLKLILKRGPVKAAPYYHHFDPYRGKHVVRKLRFGVDGPWIGLKRRAIAALVGGFSRRARPPEEELPSSATVLEKILDAARWAPSPDNSQPWRFNIMAEDRLHMQLNLETGNPYQFRSAMPNWLSAGMMLEALRLQALDYGRLLTWTRSGCDFDIRLKIAAVARDPLSHFIKIRTVDRSVYKLSPLLAHEKAALVAACGPGFSLQWLESASDRWCYARLAAQSTMLRLASAACHKVHQSVIDWASPFSRTGLPATALGVNPISQKLLQWGLKSWANMQKLNRFCRADLLAGAEMDLLPGMMSAGYVTVTAEFGTAQGPEDVLVAGARVYRLWLEATRLGLSFQPALGPVFAAAVAARCAPAMDGTESTIAKAAHIDQKLQTLSCRRAEELIFVARLGRPRQKTSLSRSLRRPLSALLSRKP
jgi:sulfur-carrier protein adenylyltransferase/sulfurtransferase